MRQQLLSWLTQVMMPYIILMVGFLTVTGREQRDFAGKTFKLGLEACVLGVGLAAALLGSQETPVAWQTAGLAVVFGLFLVVLYGPMNDSDLSRMRKARLSIVCSTFIFGSNTTIHASAYRPGSLISPFWAGIVAWIAPCIIFNFLVHDNKRSQTSDRNPSPVSP